MTEINLKIIGFNHTHVKEVKIKIWTNNDTCMYNVYLELKLIIVWNNKYIHK